MLRQLMLEKKLEKAKADLREHIEKGSSLRERRTAWDTRQAEKPFAFVRFH